MNSFRSGIIYFDIYDQKLRLLENLPEEKKKNMMDRVGDINERTAVLEKTDEKLNGISEFNKRLAVFNTSLSELEGWLTEARKRVDNIISPESAFSPEDRVTKTMEFQEDLRKNTTKLKI